MLLPFFDPDLARRFSRDRPYRLGMVRFPTLPLAVDFAGGFRYALYGMNRATMNAGFCMCMTTKAKRPSGVRVSATG